GERNSARAILLRRTSDGFSTRNSATPTITVSILAIKTSLKPCHNERDTGDFTSAIAATAASAKPLAKAGEIPTITPPAPNISGASHRAVPGLLTSNDPSSVPVKGLIPARYPE